MNLTFNLRDAAAPLIGERRFDMDMPLLVGAVALLALGLVMVTSASMEVAAGRLGSPLFYMNRQIVYLLISLVALAGYLKKLPPQVIAAYAGRIGQKVAASRIGVTICWSGNNA